MHAHSRAFTLACVTALAGTPLAAQPPQGSSPAVRLEPLSHVTLTVVSENTMTFDARALGEWGWSVFVEAGPRRILFDTGGGRVLAENARALDVDLSRLDAIVISHGHADHTGGLSKALDLAGKVDVFLHPAAFDPFFWRDGALVTREAMALSPEQLRARARRVVETRGPTLVAPGLMATGAIPRVNDFEDTGVRNLAFSDEAMAIPDPITADQALFFRAPEGVVVLLGCGHAGVVNTMRYVAELLGERHIYGVIGGTHLLAASKTRLEKTADAFREYGVQKVMLAHCTGVDAYAALSAALPGRCSWPGAGTRIEFGKSSR